MECRDKTRELVIMHCTKYPKLEIQDVFKYLYQSSYGCEHMVSSLESVANSILNEYNNMSNQNQSTVEQLDGQYCRVNLSCLNDGLSINTLAKMFYCSSKHEKDAKELLMKKLMITKELAREKLIPFNENDFEAALKQWERRGYPDLHHSDVFRHTYKPSYRVIEQKYVQFLPVFKEIDKRLARGSVKIAIDGGSASGKTTLSTILSEVYDCTVIHMDDFFLRPEQRTSERYAETGGNIDRERFLEEILTPLENGRNIVYRKFDCSSMSINSSEQIIPKKIIAIEGTYSMHPEFVKYYDLSIYLDISSKTQRKRILNRNLAQQAQRFFNEWIPMENKYFEQTNIKDRIDLYIEIL